MRVNAMLEVRFPTLTKIVIELPGVTRESLDQLYSGYCSRLNYYQFSLFTNVPNIRLTCNEYPCETLLRMLPQNTVSKNTLVIVQIHTQQLRYLTTFLLNKIYVTYAIIKTI